MLLRLKPDPTDKTPNHFVVLSDGVQVGRIFDRVPGAAAPRNANWCWTINGRYRRDCGLGVGGDAATREDAIAAFRKTYALAFSGSGGMFGNLGNRHPNLQFALVVLCGAVVGGFGLGAINYAMLEIATK